MDRNFDFSIIDCGVASELACRDNELGYLYHQYGITSSTPGIFNDVSDGRTWSSSQTPDTALGWSFNFTTGANEQTDKSEAYFGWAVRDGDVLGQSALFPVLPTSGQNGEWTFDNVRGAPGGIWIDPPLAEGFIYTISGGSLFTGVRDFPTGFNSQFEILVDGESLGLFSPGEEIDFGDGVSTFTLLGIDAPVDASDPTAFPLKVDFNTEFATISMSPVLIPVPAAIWLFASAIGLLGWLKRRAGLGETGRTRLVKCLQNQFTIMEIDSERGPRSAELLP